MIYSCDTHVALVTGGKMSRSRIAELAREVERLCDGGSDRIEYKENRLSSPPRCTFVGSSNISLVLHDHEWLIAE